MISLNIMRSINLSIYTQLLKIITKVTDYYFTAYQNEV